MDILNKSLRVGVIWKVLDIFSSQIITILVTIYMANILSPDDFGTIGILSFFLVVCQSISNSGMQQALIFLGDGADSNDYKTAFTINIFISVILYLCLYILSPLIESYFKVDGLNNIAKVIFLVIIIDSLAIVPKTKLIYSLKQKEITIINSLSVILSSSLAILYLYYFKDVWALVLLSLTKSICSVIGYFIYSRWLPMLYLNIHCVERLFGFGLKVLLTNILSTISFNLNSLVIGKVYDIKSVGYFQQSSNYCNLMSSSITTVIQTVIYPFFSKKKNDSSNLKHSYLTTYNYISLLTLPIFFGFSSVSSEFVKIFLNPEWIGMTPILVYLSISRIFVPLNSLNLFFLNSIGRSNLFLKSELIKFPIAILITISSCFISIETVAIGQIAITFISFIISAYYVGVVNGYGVRYQIKSIFPYFISSIIMFYAIRNVHIMNDLVSFILKILLGVVIYSICLIILRNKFFMVLIKGLKF